MSLKKLSLKQEINLALVITPMLDMAFQLLAFFILTYRPASLQEGYFAGELLKEDKKPKSGPQALPNLDDPDKKPKLEKIIKVKVTSVREGFTYTTLDKSKKVDGMPKEVEVISPLVAENKKYELVRIEEDKNLAVVGNQNTSVEHTMQALKEQLELIVLKAKSQDPEAAKEEKDKDGKKKDKDAKEEEAVELVLKLTIESDDLLKHQYFIRIYDACKAANFDQVSFARPPGLKTEVKEAPK